MKLLLLILSVVSMSTFAVQVDTQKSVIIWKASKITGDYHVGKIFLKSAKVNLKGKKLSSAEVVLDLRTFTVTNLEGEWANKFLGHIKSADFFNVKKFPTAKLKITSVKGNVAKGSLTIMGKTNSVIFPITKVSQKYVGKLSFDRTKFGMVYGSGSFFKNLGDKVINDQVEVNFEIVLKK